MSIIRLPIIRHGQTSWDKSLLPESEFERRIALVRDILRDRQLDAMFVYSDMIHSGRAAYLINCHVFDPRMPNMVLITRDAFDAVLNVTGRDLFFFSQFTKARLYNCDFLTGDMSIKLGELVKEHGLSKSRVGLVGGKDMPAVQFEKFQALFAGGTIEDCDQVFAALQRNKSETERRLMKRAAEKVEAVLADVAAYAKPGISERTLSARADYAARMNGCQDVDFLIYTPEQASAAWPKGHLPFRPVSTRELTEGDSIGVYVAMQFQGYWVELSQTVFVGKASPEQLAAQEQAISRYEDVLRSLRPGGNYGADQWNDATLSVWVHGTGADRDEEPYPTAPDEKLNAGELMAAHVAVKSENGIFFLGRQIIVSKDGSNTLVKPNMEQKAAAQAS